MFLPDSRHSETSIECHKYFFAFSEQLSVFLQSYIHLHIKNTCFSFSDNKFKKKPLLHLHKICLSSLDPFSQLNSSFSVQKA